MYVDVSKKKIQLTYYIIFSKIKFKVFRAFSYLMYNDLFCAITVVTCYNKVNKN